MPEAQLSAATPGTLAPALLVLAIIAFAGAAGGAANYFLPPSDGSKPRDFQSALRYSFVGMVVAFVVPLFLSMAQSSLVKSIQDGMIKSGNIPLSELLILIGFCIVASFASRSFMSNMTDKIMQQMGEIREDVKDVKDKSIETSEIMEEGIDRAAESGSERKESSGPEDLPPSPPSSPLPPSGSNVNQSISPRPELSSEEFRALRALSRVSTRTPSGIAREISMSRGKTLELVDSLVLKGAAKHAISANTGGARVAITQTGADLLNDQSRYVLYNTSPNASHD